MSIRIKGTGSALPSNIFTNDDIAKIVDTNDEWIRERTGIASRRISDGDTVASLGAKACINALENAGKSAREVDLIIVASCSSELSLPCTACQIQHDIGAINAVAFDLNAACSGFMFALNSAYVYLENGIYKNALIVGSEVLSKIVDWTDRGTCILFGDGAGAVYVESTKEKLTYSFVQHSDGSKGNALSCNCTDLVTPLVSNVSGNHFVQMDGKEIFRFAVKQVPDTIIELLEKNDRPIESINLFVLHQANARIISSIAKRLNMDIAKFPTTIEKYGNMSSATIPVLLDELNRNGILVRGMDIVLSGFGAGLTYGATLMTW